MLLVAILLSLVTLSVVLALVARRLGVPHAVLLVLGGMALALVPGLPRIALDPELALAFFLPPLLQASAFRTDWRAFRFDLRPILLLAVGAVLFTALCVAVVARWLIPDLPWAAAVALGAILAPPDAVAAAAVLGRLRIPRRIVTVLEGESLVNDASALVLYRTALAALAAGGVTLGEVAGSLLVVTAGGFAFGWLAGRAAAWLLRRVEEPVLEVALSFVLGFAVYAAAEQAHASGVIAVVTAGGILGREQHSALDPRTRLEARVVWEFAEFLLTSLVFVLVGLQLNDVLGRLGGRSWVELAGLAAAISLTLVVSRLAWVYPATWLPRLVPAVARRDPIPRGGAVFVIGWAGMRGVVSLAAALALPLSTPERDLMVFLTFCAILATLVLQGTTLEWVIRRLGVEEKRAPGMPEEEARARLLVAEAARAEVEARLDSEVDGAIARDLVAEYRDLARVFGAVAGQGMGQGISQGSGGRRARAELMGRLHIRLAALRAGRDRLLAHHAEGGLEAELLGGITAEMDHEELRLRRLLAAGGRG